MPIYEFNLVKQVKPVKEAKKNINEKLCSRIINGQNKIANLDQENSTNKSKHTLNNQTKVPNIQSNNEYNGNLIIIEEEL